LVSIKSNRCQRQSKKKMEYRCIAAKKSLPATMGPAGQSFIIVNAFTRKDPYHTSQYPRSLPALAKNAILSAPS
jgi:hypothetical protein